MQNRTVTLASFLLAILGILLLAPGTAHATNYIYTGLAATCPFPVGQCDEFVPGNPANWGDHRNWSPQGVPGPSDSAIINGNSSVNLNGSRTILRLTLNNGTQFGTGLEGGTVTITGAAPTYISSWVSGNFACNVNIGAGARLDIAGNGGRGFVGGTTNNSGTVNWSGAMGLSCVNNPTFNNQSGGVFNVSSTGQYAPNAGNTVFNNLAGATFNKTGAGTTAFGNVTFNNSGTVNGIAGTLDIFGGRGNSGGVYNVADKARVNVTGGHSGTFNPAAGGVLGITEATFYTGLKCIGTGRSEIFSGTVNIVGSVTVGETNGPGILEIAPLGFSIVNVTGQPSGSLNCAGTGYIDWKGGSIGNNTAGVLNLAQSCVLRITTNAQKSLIGETVNNHGAVHWTGIGGVNCLDSPTFNNLSGAVFNASNDGQWSQNAGVTVFNNHAGAVLNKSGAGTQTLFQSVNINNAGTVNALSGLLANDLGNGTSSGTFNAANGARVNVSGTVTGTLNAAAGGIVGLRDATLNAGTRIIGAGKAKVADGTVMINGAVTVGSPGGPGTLEIEPDGFNSINFTGTPSGNLSCAGTGVIDWKSGVIGTGSGGVINLNSSAILKLTTGGNHALQGGTINNSGLLNWLEGGLQLNFGAVINNLSGGTFNTPADRYNIGSPNGAATAINNSGTFNIGGVNGVGELDLDGVSFNNNASGTVGLELGGTAAGTQHDQLNMVFNANLGATLRIGLVNGFHPNGESFTIMTYPSRTGNFSTFTGLNVGGGKVLTATANATNLIIADPNAPVTVRTISGRVTTAANVGVGGIQLKRTNSTAVATTDASGNYTFTNVLPGTVSVLTGQLGYTFSPTSRTFNVAGTNVTGVNFTATGATFTISGRVINNSVVGIPNVLISRSNGPNVTTNASGNFVMTGVTVGTYLIAPVQTPSVNGWAFTPASYPVNVTTSNLSNITFTASFTVTGRVANHSGGGIPNVQVQRVAGSSTVSVFTDGNGNYTFTGVRSGSYTLAPVITPAMTGVSFSPTSRSLTVDRNNITNQNFIGLFSVSGVIKTSGGAAIPNVLVRLNNGSTSTTALTDAAGAYRFINVRSGTYSITPTLSGRTFGPAARNGVVVSTVSIGNQNFTGSG